MAMTVRETLALCGLPESAVVAGSAGLDRPVEAVNIMEAPDISDWLGGNDLVLTALYAIREDTTAQCQLVRSLHATGAAGLMVKTKRWVDRLSEPMLGQAESLEFPIIEIPTELRFGQVLRLVLGDLVDRQAAALRHAADLHRRFTAIALQQGGLQAIARDLAAMLQAPVAFCSADDRLLAGGLPELELGDAAGPPELAESLGAVPGCQRLPVVLGPEPGGEPSTATAVRCVIAPLDVPLGDLWVVETKRRLDDWDLIAVQQAAAVAALELVRGAAVAEVERRFRDEFLGDLVTGRVFDAAVVRTRAAAQGWNLDGPLQLAVVRRDVPDPLPAHPAPGDAAGDGGRLAHLGAVEASLRPEDRGRVHVGCHDGDVVLIGPVPAADWIQVLGERLRKASRRGSPRTPAVTFSLGASEPADDYGQLARCYREACDAIHFGRLLNGPDQTHWYRDLGFFRLLASVSDEELLQSTVPIGLRRLVAYDDAHGTELRHTLRTYLECNGHMRVTSGRLYIHYKTLCYRLGRIRQIAGADLENGPTRMDLFVGLRILDLLERTRPRPCEPVAAACTGAPGRD